MIGFSRKAPGVPVYRGAKVSRKYIFLLAAVSICAIVLLNCLPIRNNEQLPYNSMVSAAERMSYANQVISATRREMGIPINLSSDPNRTGLIGGELTELTTTLGDLEAKRTTTSPNFAALMVLLLHESGIEDGDDVAIGASGSFPGATVATLCAAAEIGANPIVIYSLGASIWGANVVDLTILDIHKILYQEGVIPFGVAAASLGGRDDIGRSLTEDVRVSLEEKIENSRAEFLDIPILQKNVEKRIDIYQRRAADGVDVFINIGGAVANMGTSAEVLQLKPGINRINRLPRPGERGVIYALAAQNIPIIHILNLEKLAVKYNLSWDPVPLPEPGQGKIYDRRPSRPMLFWALFSCYLVSLAVVGNLARQD